MAARAIYPGSFDPPTNGHVDIIRRGLGLFDSLIVAVGNNPAKRYLFDLDERQRLLKQAMPDLELTIAPFSGLLVDAAKEHGASVIVRGLRPLGDFDLEFRNGLANRNLTGIETVLLLADPAHAYVSSSLVKEIATHGGDVSAYVSPAIQEALERRVAG